MKYEEKQRRRKLKRRIFAVVVVLFLLVAVTVVSWDSKSAASYRWYPEDKNRLILHSKALSIGIYRGGINFFFTKSTTTITDEAKVEVMWVPTDWRPEDHPELVKGIRGKQLIIHIMTGWRMVPVHQATDEYYLNYPSAVQFAGFEWLRIEYSHAGLGHTDSTQSYYAIFPVWVIVIVPVLLMVWWIIKLRHKGPKPVGFPVAMLESSPQIQRTPSCPG